VVLRVQEGRSLVAPRTCRRSADAGQRGGSAGLLDGGARVVVGLGGGPVQDVGVLAHVRDPPLPLLVLLLPLAHRVVGPLRLQSPQQLLVLHSDP